MVGVVYKKCWESKNHCVEIPDTVKDTTNIISDKCVENREINDDFIFWAQNEGWKAEGKGA